MISTSRTPRSTSFLLLSCAISLLPVPAAAQSGVQQDLLKINTRRLSDRVLLTWACDYFQGTNMAVVAGESGLVIIDTGLSHSTVRRQRELIEKELDRSDFRYLVITHMHNDHAFANEVFPEATVVAHRDGTEALRREVERIPELLERLRSSREGYREWAAETSPDSADGKKAREGVAAFDVGIADLEAGIQPRYPARTVDGHDTLSLGDVHLEIFEFTGLHSESDILVLVPEEKMLFTGDVFWGGQLPVLHEVTAAEIDRTLAAWKTILEMAPDLETVVPGHSDVPLTPAQFQEMYAYLSRLREDVRSAKAEGTPLMTLLARTDFKGRYPEIADYNWVRRDYNLHQHNVYVLWFMQGETD